MIKTCLLALLVAITAFDVASAQAPGEPPEGFVALFDGESLAGWQGGSTHDPRAIDAGVQAKWDAAIPDHWRVEDGELVNDGQEPHLATKREFGDFELWVDWKLSPGGDSGIYLRGCPQVQLWDPQNKEAWTNGSDKGSGGLWNNEKHERWPLAVADKPTGQWNRMYVRMVGEYVKVVLNDKVVVDNVVLENYYDRSAPVPMRGTIHLQTHGSETRFDNVFVREIPAEEASEILSQIGADESEFESVFNGKDFEGWIGATDQYEVVDGTVRCQKGAGGNLLTAAKYGDFIARLEFKLPPGGNNGLAIRASSPEADSAYEGVELQVLDTEDPMYKDIKPYQAHGSAYGLAAAHRGYLRPTGAWNYQEVEVKGDRYIVRLNGFTILDVDLATVRDNPPDGNKHPGAFRTSGHFGFAGHNDPVAFRNIRIKPLP